MARTAERIQMGLAALVILGVFSQVYFIASYFFGAGADALDVHKTVGGIVHGLEVLVFVAALFAKADRWLAFALAAIGTVQLALADADKWAGGLHGLFATFVLLLAAAIVWRARGRSAVAAG